MFSENFPLAKVTAYDWDGTSDYLTCRFPATFIHEKKQQKQVVPINTIETYFPRIRQALRCLQIVHYTPRERAQALHLWLNDLIEPVTTILFLVAGGSVELDCHARVTTDVNGDYKILGSQQSHQIWLSKEAMDANYPGFNSMYAFCVDSEIGSINSLRARLLCAFLSEPFYSALVTTATQKGTTINTLFDQCRTLGVSPGQAKTTLDTFIAPTGEQPVVNLPLFDFGVYS